MALIGVVFLIFGIKHSRDAHWRLRALSHGRASEPEWIQHLADQQGWWLRWFGIPFALIWTAAGLFLLVQGLISRY
jgi:hypothetical protein